MAISLCLNAKNSSGMQRLLIDVEEKETFLTLLGVFKGGSIQIDFDPLSENDLRDFISFLDHRLNSKIAHGK